MNREDIKNWSNSNGLGYRSDLHEMYERLYLSAYNDGVSAERDRIKQANAPEIERVNAHIKELENACKKPEQEPVAWYRDEDGIRIYYETKCWDDATPLYTTPQTWEKFCDSNCVWTDHHPDCKLAEQEPVAWRHKQFFETREGWFYADWHSDGINPPSAELLYTTPPQRKPLTDEQARFEFEVWHKDAYTQSLERYGHTYKNHHTRCRWQGWLAAHGIKEKNT